MLTSTCFPSSGTWSSVGPTQPTGCVTQSARIWSMQSFGCQTGGTCLRECSLCLPNTITITMDASMEGCGGHCIVPGLGTVLYSDLWTRDESQLHINVLELKAVDLTLLHLEQKVLCQKILIEVNNTATMTYINRQGGVVSETFNDEASLCSSSCSPDQSGSGQYTDQMSTMSWLTSCHTIAQTPQSGASRREWYSSWFSCGANLR